MKARVGVLVVLLCVFSSGCVAIPPLINVHHDTKDTNLKSRVDELERRVRDLEQREERR